MNEVITLRFVEYSDATASWMLRCGRTFASSKPGGRHGERAGTLFVRGPDRCLAYWTKARSVVVRELEAT